LYNTFALAYSFDQDISGWYTDAVNEMVGTFSSAKSFNRDISEWHTGAVTSLQEMFSFSSSFNVDISGWDTTSVTSYESMFKYTYDFNQVLCWNIGGGNHNRYVLFIIRLKQPIRCQVCMYCRRILQWIKLPDMPTRFRV